MEKMVNQLIQSNSKSWLADKLGIQRKTLDVRLKKSNWKKSEIQVILMLHKNNIVLV